MGGDLGLVLALSLDNTQAQMEAGQFGATLEGLGASAAKGGRGMADGLAPGDKALINSHQSVHLLAEEMGIHLPRAVVGAVSEMLPSIASLGSGLLAVFAVREATEFTEYLHKMVDDFNGVARAEKEMAEAGAKNLSRLEEMAKKSAAYARDQLKNLRVEMAQEQAKVNELVDLQDTRIQHSGMLVTKAWGKLSGATKELDDATKQLARTTELYRSMVEITGEDEVKSRKEAERLAKKADNEAREFHNRRVRELTWVREQNERVQREQIKGMQEAAKLADHLRASEEGVAQAQRNIAASAISLAVNLEAVGIVEGRSFESFKTLIPQITGNIVHLTEAKRMHAYVSQEMRSALDQENKSLAHNIDFVAAGAAGILETLGLKREYAAVMAIYETAKGFEALGDFDFWAAAQDFSSAGMYAKVAGTGSSRQSAIGLGGAGNRSTYGRGGEQVVERGGGGHGGAGSEGGNTVVSIPGKLSLMGQQQMAAWLGVGASAGIFTITAQKSSGVAVPSY